jgi:hypothetical protein
MFLNGEEAEFGFDRICLLQPYNFYSVSMKQKKGIYKFIPFIRQNLYKSTHTLPEELR